MHTLGYRFRPWRGDTALADGASILDYVRDTAREYGVDRHIRYGHHVIAAAWDSATARWTVTAEVDGERRTTTADFLWACSGYYDYDAGLHARTSRARSASAARSSTRSTGPRTSTTPASGSS